MIEVMGQEGDGFDVTGMRLRSVQLVKNWEDQHRMVWLVHRFGTELEAIFNSIY